MNCHSQIFANSPFLEPVRESFESDRPIEWTRVHDLPDFVLLRSQHPRRQGRRLHDLPRAGRPDAADVAGEVAADGVVPRLPPPPGAVRPPAQRRCSASTYEPPANQLELGERLVARVRRFRSSRAARRVTDERRPEPDLDRLAEPTAATAAAAAKAGGEPSTSSPTIRRFASGCTTSSRRRSRRSTDPVERRTFLKLMGASLALAGVTACTRQPPEKIVPYVRQPEEIVPGGRCSTRPR